jgi:PBP1b-binding outer membrane lipoprotein LpoB
MRITKTLAALAVVALLLNGCACVKKIAGDKADKTATPTPLPTPSPRA